MIRFIDVGSQVGLDETWPRQFSFWDTVTDRYIELDGEQMWSTWAEFEETYLGAASRPHNLERFKSLCPEWVFTSKGFDDGR
jgi:hypothetical protein